ncbi:MAG: Crp/Fnr family transcriptional regulator [bacterium]
MPQHTFCTDELKNAGFCSVCKIRETSLCATVDPEEMQLISKTMAHHSIKEGQALVSAGEISKYLYIVVSGVFRLVRFMDDGRRQITGFVFPGEIVGVSRTKQSIHTAEALEPSLVCSFSHSYLNEISHRFPDIKDKLIARGDTELEKAEDHIMLLGKQTAHERVISFIELLLAKQSGADNRIYLPMSRQDIADYLGLRLETLSRTLASLKKDGHLQKVSGRFIDISSDTEMTK